MQLEELQQFANTLAREMFGTKRRTRGRSDKLSLYLMEDGTHYYHKKNMLSSGKTLKRRISFDCMSILELYQEEQWLPKVEDMTREEITQYCRKKLKF